MVTDLSEKISDQLVTDGIITNESKSLYSYGLFIAISNIIYFLFCALCGFILKFFFPGILFYITCFIIRSFAGGYHAPTEKKCMIISFISIAISLVFIKLFINNCSSIIISLIFFISVGLIFLIAPIDNNEKKLNSKEKNIFRFFTRLVVSLCAILAIILYRYNHIDFSYAIQVSVFLQAILMVAGKIKNIAQQKKYDNINVK